jgi:hypothetical protein
LGRRDGGFRIRRFERLPFAGFARFGAFFRRRLFGALAQFGDFGFVIFAFELFAEPTEQAALGDGDGGGVAFRSATPRKDGSGQREQEHGESEKRTGALHARVLGARRELLDF